jgi:hypothetical protein
MSFTPSTTRLFWATKRSFALGVFLLCCLPLSLWAHHFHHLRIHITERDHSLECRVNLPYVDLIRYVGLEADTLIDADYDKNWKSVLEGRTKIKNWLNQALTIGAPPSEITIEKIKLVAIDTPHGEYTIIDEVKILFNLSKNLPNGELVLSQNFDDSMFEDGLKVDLYFTGLDADTLPFILKKNEALKFSITDPPGIWLSITQFVEDGFKHILDPGVLTGKKRGDHLAFLLGLILIYRKFKPLLIATGLFTVAHCLTLLLSGLNFLNLPPIVVEPLIALTVAASGYHAFKSGEEKTSNKWAYVMIFIFGLIHGLGFAFEARERFDPGADILLWLFSFNIGIELGQIAVLMVFYILFKGLGKNKEIQGKSAYALSALLLFLGSYWFVGSLLVG